MADSYSDSEMDEILRRAMAQEQQGSVSREDLIAAAQEVGIDPAAVQAAMREVQDERKKRDREELVLREHRKGFWPSLGRFTMVNAICVGTNLLTGGQMWFWWVLLFTGLLMARRAVITMWPAEHDLARADKRLRRKEQRALKRRDRAEWERQKAASRRQTQDQFERVVEQGVQALLTAAADHLEKVNSSPPAASHTPRVRVEQAGDEEDEGGETASRRGRP